MAINNQQLVGTFGASTPDLRAFPTQSHPKTFANVAGGPTLARLTPVAYNTSTNKWVAWDAYGGNDVETIRGFVYPEAIVLDATNDVIGVVMTEGNIHYDDIALPTGEVEADLKAALQSGVKDRGFNIQGLINVR